jgi:hypothetical protein
MKIHPVISEVLKRGSIITKQTLVMKIITDGNCDERLFLSGGCAALFLVGERIIHYHRKFDFHLFSRGNGSR